MFASQAVKSLHDLSRNISDPEDWDAGLLKTVEYHLDVTAIAYEPTSGLFAVGTARGTIHLYGSPGVECQLKTTDPPGLRIKYLQFATSAFKLLCIDQQDRLIVWNLTNTGRPSLQKITRFGHQIYAIITSPSHNHAFIALSNGEVKTYDLLCLRTSQYIVPNLWKMYEEISLTRDSLIAGPSPSDMIVDIAIHPRDLNLLFVAYEGGVVMSDLKEQKPVRTFELTLSPGAPGAAGYHSKDILLPRRQFVTAFAIHPSGHLVAIGYADGTIGFWSLEDEDKPLLLRTINSPEGEDLSAVDPDKLDAALGQKEQHPLPPREPIFKLAWSGFPNSSDPRGGDTVLTVLGGLVVDSQQCITTLLLPPLQPPAPPPPSSPNAQPGTPSLHPETCAAMRTTLAAKKVYSYIADGPVQDFILFSRASPHFAGTYDPSTILILCDSEVRDVRICEAYEFPPPSFIEQPEPVPAQEQEGADVEPDDELVRILQEMMLSGDPRPATVPPSLWSVLGADLVKLDDRPYATLVRDKFQPVDGEVPFPNRGGVAWSEDEDGLMKQAKYTQKQPHRILISRLRDLSVRFMDLSAQLLISTGPDSPCTSDFPSPIPQLTIELIPIVVDYSLGLTGSTQFEGLLNKYHINAVHFGRESFDCVTVLSTQAVILHRLDVPVNTTRGQQTLEDKELVSLSHIPVRKGLRYSPVVAIKPDKPRGVVSSCALSDAGFLAVAYSSGALLIVNLRGPSVILRIDPASHKRSNLLGRHAAEPIQTMIWVSCALETDPTFRIRLICTAVSGQSTIYTLENQGPSTWGIADNPVAVDGSARPLSTGSFVLDTASGVSCRATLEALSTIVMKTAGLEAGRKYLWVSVGAKGVRCALNVNGERIAKAEWSSKVGTAEHAEIVERVGSFAVVAYTNLGYALMYTLPHLEHVVTAHIETSGFSSPPSTDESGDYITHRAFPAGSPPHPLLATELHTHFVRNRTPAYQPVLVDLTRGRGAIPAQPQPVSLGPPSMMSSVMGYIGSFSAAASAGSEIDALLAGPDRPVPAPNPGPARPGSVTLEKSANAPSSQQSSLAAATAGVSSGVNDLYSRLGNALSERSERLADLQQTLESVEKGSKDMVAQAKRIAAEQSAKRWFGF